MLGPVRVQGCVVDAYTLTTRTGKVHKKLNRIMITGNTSMVFWLRSIPLARQEVYRGFGGLRILDLD